MDGLIPIGGRTARQLLVAGCSGHTVARFLGTDLDLDTDEIHSAIEWACGQCGGRPPAPGRTQGMTVLRRVDL